MKKRNFWRNAVLLLGMTRVVTALAVMPIFSHQPAARATADGKYGVATLPDLARRLGNPRIRSGYHFKTAP